MFSLNKSIIHLFAEATGIPFIKSLINSFFEPCYVLSIVFKAGLSKEKFSSSYGTETEKPK